MKLLFVFFFSCFIHFAYGAENGQSNDQEKEYSTQVQASLVWVLHINAPDKLKQLLATYLDLAHGQANTESELRRLVAATPAQAKQLLQAQGYFAPEVRIKMEEAVAGQSQVIHLTVEPGPLARVEKVQLLFEGDLDNQLSNEEPQAMALVDELNKRWSMPVGEVMTQESWRLAKSQTLAWLRAHGFPLASWSGTSATVDAQAQTVRLFLVADSGPALVYGGLKVEGLKHQPLSAIENLMPFKLNEAYLEKNLLDFQERLQKLNLFESVFVAMGDSTGANDKQVPLTVQVRELPLQQATLGIGVSSDTGPRASVEHVNRLLWGFPWQAKSILQIGRDESLVKSDLSSHPLANGKRWLTSVQALRQIDEDKSVTKSAQLKFGMSFENEQLVRTTSIELERTLVRSISDNSLSSASAISLLHQWLRRDVDNIVLPTKGYTANLYAGLGRSFSTLNDSGWFARSYGRLSLYHPLPSNWHALVRGELGQVFAASNVSIPDTMLYRAGGDESVRGYGYKTLGLQQDGATLGGNSLVTASVELAHPITKRFPSLWGAVFTDVGDAAPTWSELKPKLGYGVGIRWRSPVGALRLDVAYGKDIRAYRLHFGVGIVL